MIETADVPQVARMEKINSHFFKGRFLNVIVGLFVLILLPGMYFGIAQYRLGGQYSLFDEATHISYAWQVSHGELPAKGGTIPPEILNDWSCEGQNNVSLPKCNSNSSPSSYPALGENYNYFHPPLYYLTAGFGARVLTSVTSLSFSESVRVFSLIWLIAGIILLYFSIRKWDISKLAAYCTCALVPFIPVFFNQGTAATNDAGSVFSGALVLWLTARLFKEKNQGILLPVAFVFIACLIKGTNGFAFLGLAFIVGVKSIIKIYQRQFHDGIHLLSYAFIVAFSTALSIFGWSTFQNNRGIASWKNPVGGISTYPVKGLPLGELGNTATNGLSLAGGRELLRGFGNSVGMASWIFIITLLLMSAAWILLFMSESGSADYSLSTITIASMLIYPTLIQAQIILQSNEAFGALTPRYGLPIVPLVLGCWATCINKRNSKILMLIPPILGAAVSYISVLGVLPFIPAT